MVGAVTVPIYVEDPDPFLGGLLRKASAFGMGGWWLGATHMVPNPDFISQVGSPVSFLHRVQL